MDALSAEIYILVLFALGVAVGSFLNVVLYRLHTGRQTSGRSHCLSCGTQLRWTELVPVFSYAWLRGRCRACGSYIPYRYIVVELLTGGLFVLTWFAFPYQPILIVFHAAIVSLLIVILVYDLMHMIVPDELVWGIGVVVGGVLGYGWLMGTYSAGDVVAHVAAAVGAAAFFASFWLISKGRWMGLGDAKLAFPLALLLGPLGALTMVVLAFWIGAAISVACILVQRLRQTGKTHLLFGATPIKMKSEIPFAPFLIAAFIIVHFLHVTFYSVLTVFSTASYGF